MDDSIIAAAAACWGATHDALAPLPGGHFAQVFGFTHGDQDYVLRITPPDASVNLASTQAMLTFQHYLRAGGASVPGPVTSRNDRFIEVFVGPGGPEAPAFLATVFTRAQGALAEERPVETWDNQLIVAIGRAVGRLHHLSCRYRADGPALDRPSWQDNSNCFHPAEALAEAQDPASPHHWILAKRAAVLAELEGLPKTAPDWAIIHADLHYGNFFFDFDQHAVTLLDFDDCCWGWLGMDIAMNLLDALVLYRGPDRAGFARRFWQCYLEGYRSANSIDQAWIRRLPLFLKLLELGLYLQVAGDEQPEDVDSWVGRFMAGRKEKIAQDCAFVDPALFDW